MSRSARLRPSLLFLLTLGCGGADRSGAGTVIIASPADTETLLPALRTAVTGRMVRELLFDPLIELGPTLDPFGDAGFEPRLAARWAWDADSLALSLTLDAAARWHDGRPVVAADVVTGYQQNMDPANGSAIRSEITDLDSVTAPDARTAVLHFRRRTAEPFVTAAAVVPLPSHLIDTIPPPAAWRRAPSRNARSGVDAIASWRASPRRAPSSPPSPTTIADAPAPTASPWS